MFRKIKKEYLVGSFIFLVVFFLPASVVAVISSFFSISNIETDICNFISISNKTVAIIVITIIYIIRNLFWFSIIVVPFIIIIFRFFSENLDQIRAFSKTIPTGIFIFADILLAIMLLLYIELMPYLICADNISNFSTLVSIISGSIVIPLMKHIIDIPIVKVEVLNNQFSYNEHSILELNPDSFISIRAINNSKDTQTIKFLGFCHAECENSIAMGRAQSHNTVYLPQNIKEEEYVTSVLEPVAPHSISQEYNDIAISEVIMPLIEVKTKLLKKLLSYYSSAEIIKIINRLDTQTKIELLRKLLNYYSSAMIFRLLINQGYTERRLISALLDPHTSPETIETFIKHDVGIKFIKKTLFNRYNSYEVVEKLVKSGDLTASNLIKILFSPYSSSEIINILTTVKKHILTQIKTLLTSSEIIDALFEQNALVTAIEILTDVEKQKKQVFIDAVYENESGNYCFKTFNVNIGTKEQ